MCKMFLSFNLGACCCCVFECVGHQAEALVRETVHRHPTAMFLSASEVVLSTQHYATSPPSFSSSSSASSSSSSHPADLAGMMVLGIRGIAGDTVLRVPAPASAEEDKEKERGAARTMTTTSEEEEEVSVSEA